MLWTVVRFPNGTWSTGGSPNDPEYSECEVWCIDEESREAAKRVAQRKRAYHQRKSRTKDKVSPCKL